MEKLRWRNKGGKRSYIWKKGARKIFHSFVLAAKPVASTECAQRQSIICRSMPETTFLAELARTSPLLTAWTGAICPSGCSRLDSLQHKMYFNPSLFPSPLSNKSHQQSRNRDGLFLMCNIAMVLPQPQSSCSVLSLVAASEKNSRCYKSSQTIAHLLSPLSGRGRLLNISLWGGKRTQYRFSIRLRPEMCEY